MAAPLAKRLETAIVSLIETALPSAQVVQFGDGEKAEKDYIAVRAVRVAEDPVGSGMFSHDVTVTAHGQHADQTLDTLEEVFDNAYEFSTALATEGTGQFVMPQGQAVDLDGGTKTGAGLDETFTYTFGVWAQTKEISDAA